MSSLPKVLVCKRKVRGKRKMSIGCSVQTILISPDCFPFQNLLFLFSFLLIEHRTPLIIWDFDGFSLFLLWLTAEAELIYWCYTTTLRIMSRAAASACSASRSRCCASARTRWPDISTLQLESKVHPKVRNHGEGPYKGLLLVESGYYRFHI